MRAVTGFVFQRSYYEAIRCLPDAERLQILDAITDYAFERAEPEDMSVTGVMAWTLIKPTLDASLARYSACKANGARGGRPKKADKTS